MCDAENPMSTNQNVKEQYADGSNLSVRTRLHQLYSTNKQGLFPWLYAQYRFTQNSRILELGCGNGAQWEGRLKDLPTGARILLLDFSPGMVDAVRVKYAKFRHTDFQQIDIQNIPVEENFFDVVIANHMLYHVPDLNRALSEVRRVLKNGGTFYAATNGDGGMRAVLAEAFRQINLESKAFSGTYSFSLQNGGEVLNRYFKSVERRDYEDALAISQTEDLMGWIRSNLTIASYTEKDLHGLFEYFEALRKRDGFIHIPKESGLLICRKSSEKAA